MNQSLLVVLTVILLAACNDSAERDVGENEDDVSEAVQGNFEGLVQDNVLGSDESLLLLAENFIDAFYSFDAVLLEGMLTSAPDSLLPITYYQGWAEGGNYKILERKPCVPLAANIVSCSITVEDDAMLALGSDFKVTDTFTIAFGGSDITSVETSSDDLPIYFEAGDWVRENLPELIEEPCQGFFAGGPTPGDCARAMAEGYARFAARDGFTGN